jgi:pimeloyl-ACP methyl ester carboxylesterase
VYEVVGWRLRWSQSAMVVHSRSPDARWFGSAPELYADRRGPGVDKLIERIDRAARDYPYGADYRAWPGPNSNTFTAWIAGAVPELEVDLPATAIGKDYLGSSIVGAAPSGSGYQLSLVGVLGLTVSGVDGLEFNVLGLNFGIESQRREAAHGGTGRKQFGAKQWSARVPTESPAAEDIEAVLKDGGKRCTLQRLQSSRLRDSTYVAIAGRRQDAGQRVVIPNAGHAMSWMNPTAFNAAVLAFLDGK